MLRVSIEVTRSSRIRISPAVDAHGCTGPVALETYKRLSRKPSPQVSRCRLRCGATLHANKKARLRGGGRARARCAEGVLAGGEGEPADQTANQSSAGQRSGT